MFYHRKLLRNVPMIEQSPPGRIALRRRGIMLPEATRRRRRILQSGASPSRIEGYREFEADLSALFFWRFLAEIEFSQIKTK